jgi:hypothetical protein
MNRTGYHKNKTILPAGMYYNCPPPVDLVSTGPDWLRHFTSALMHVWE